MRGCSVVAMGLKKLSPQRAGTNSVLCRRSRTVRTLNSLGESCRQMLKASFLSTIRLPVAPWDPLLGTRASEPIITLNICLIRSAKAPMD